MRRACFVVLAAAVASPLAACSSKTPAGSSGDDDTSGGGGAAVVLSAPQVVNLAGGKVLTAPKVQLIGYAEDSYLPDVEGFLAELAKTTTWAEQTSEYGVGALTVLPTISISGAPPSTLDDVSGSPTPLETTLAANTTGTSPAWGAADASTVYLFVLPVGTQVNTGTLCCDPTAGFYGYHYEAAAGSISVPYAVVCNCPSLDVAPLTALQWVTTSVSHELVEAATNPRVASSPAFSQVDQPHEVWDLGSFGGEIADMCQDNLDTNVIPAGSTYMVQRSWSNAAAKAGTNPCVPVPEGAAYDAYFNTYPSFPDEVTPSGGTSFPPGMATRGVKIAVGESRTIDLTLHASGATSGPWTLAVEDFTAFASGEPSSAVTDVSLDASSGKDGDVVHLTIKVLAADPSFGGEAFVLSSTLDGQNNLWFGAVAQQ
jgi:hypothetical protein